MNHISCKFRISSLLVVVAVLVFFLTGMYRYTEKTVFIDLKNAVRTYGLLICVMAMYLPSFKKIKVCKEVIFAFLFGITMIITLATTGGLKLALITEVTLWPMLLLLEYRRSYLLRQPDWSESAIKKGGIVLLLFCYLLVANSNHEYRFYTQSLYHAYYAITFFPFVLNLQDTKKNTKYKLIYGILVCILMVFSKKRGGIIAFVIGVLIYYIVKTFTNYGLTKKVKRMGVLLLLIIVGYNYFEFMTLHSSSELISRLNDLTLETGSSGRNYIWEAIIQAFIGEDTFGKLFGAGFNGTYSVTSNVAALSTLAHNDYIGILYDYGLVSLIAVALFCISMIFTTIKSIVKKNKYAAPLAYSVAVVSVLSMVSTCLSSSEIIMFFALFWGQSLAAIKLGRKDEVNTI